MKLVKEHINEIFTEESDPIKDMNIGIKHKIEEWINNFEEMRGDRYITHIELNDKLEINADYCDITWEEFNVLPEYIRFNNIKKGFYCCFDNIKTIKENGPKYVGEDYKIYVNKNKIIDFSEEDVLKVCKIDISKIKIMKM